MKCTPKLKCKLENKNYRGGSTLTTLPESKHFNAESFTSELNYNLFFTRYIAALENIADQHFIVLDVICVSTKLLLPQVPQCLNLNVFIFFILRNYSKYDIVL